MKANVDLTQPDNSRRKKIRKSKAKPEDRLCAILNSLDVKQRVAMAHLLR